MGQVIILAGKVSDLSASMPTSAASSEPDSGGLAEAEQSAQSVQTSNEELGDGKHSAYDRMQVTGILCQTCFVVDEGKPTLACAKARCYLLCNMGLVMLLLPG